MKAESKVESPSDKIPNPEFLASQLRKPEGDFALEIGKKMNEANYLMNIFAIEKLELTANECILEVGMGNGFFVGEILSIANGVIYTGLDYSTEMVEQAKKGNKSSVESGQANFIVGKADELPFEKNYFDRILTVNTVYFWDEPVKVLSEFRRTLKPGGRLVIGIRPKEVMEYYPFTTHGFKLYTTNELAQLLEGTGFKLIETVDKEEPSMEFEGQKMKTGFAVITVEI